MNASELSIHFSQSSYQSRESGVNPGFHFTHRVQKVVHGGRDCQMLIFLPVIVCIQIVSCACFLLEILPAVVLDQVWLQARVQHISSKYQLCLPHPAPAQEKSAHRPLDAQELGQDQDSRLPAMLATFQSA